MSVRPRVIVPLAIVLLAMVLLPGLLVAQSPPTTPQPGTAAKQLTFELRWPAADPQWYQLVCKPDGSARYRSIAGKSANSSDPDPFELSFTLTPASRQLIFSVASQLAQLRPTLDKTKVAFTGTKTIRFEDGSGDAPAELSYNYSASPQLLAFTDRMEAISETIELAQTLHFQQRFDKLAIDSTLRHAADLASMHRLAEAQLIAPTLERVANDSSILNMARQRARRILESLSPAGAQQIP